MIGLKPVGIETAGKAITQSLPCLYLKDLCRDGFRMNWLFVFLCAVKKLSVACIPDVGDGGLSGKHQHSGNQLRWAIFLPLSNKRPSFNLYPLLCEVQPYFYDGDQWVWHYGGG